MVDVKSDAKPNVKQDPSDQILQIKITSNHDSNSSIIFKVKPSTKFLKVVEAWGKQKGIEPKQFKFLDPEGKRIHHSDTSPKHWGMTIEISRCDNGFRYNQALQLEDEDEIVAMKEQVGGGSVCTILLPNELH